MGLPLQQALNAQLLSNYNGIYAIDALVTCAHLHFGGRPIHQKQM